MILDGWGFGTEKSSNAVYMAHTPFLDDILKNYRHAKLTCSGDAVGLPAGIMGNSEVGHLNIGAGRVVYQDLLKINLAIKKGDFFQNKTINALLSKVKEKEASVHFIGLVSDGGVHSDLSHLFALIDLAKEKKLEHVHVHAILDGRDTPPDSGAAYIRQLVDYMDKTGCGRLSTVCGRFYAMDRDNRWDRVEKAYRLYTAGDGQHEKDPVQAVLNAYKRGETDEFVTPVVMDETDRIPNGLFKDNDGVIFFNFRADRARELTRAFIEPEFDGFQRTVHPQLSSFVTMTQYDEAFDIPCAFPPEKMKLILGEVLARAGMNQLRIAETEKYAHVTYFFNGGEEKPFPKEDRILIPSPREVSTYDEKPEMSAPQVTETVLEKIDSGIYDLIVLNFANMDMVGHTGVFDAAVKACETVDACVKKVAGSVLEKGGGVILTADHGNSEKMKDENGKPHTAHTTNPVRVILIDDSKKHVKLKDGKLGDIAPTLLDILGLEKPEEMTGTSLIV